MGSISAAFKKQKSSTNATQQPIIKRTPFSSISGDFLSLDPSIRALQDRALTDYGNISGDISGNAQRFSTQTQGLRDKYLGDTGAFLQPLRRQLGLRRNELQNSIGQRRLGGSSFGEEALTNFDTEAESSIRAAMADIAQFEAGLNQQEFQAWDRAAQQRAAITGETLEVAKARLFQEMNSFGLGGETGQSTTKGSSFSLGNKFSFGGSGSTD